MNVDALTYAAKPSNLDGLPYTRYRLCHGDIGDPVSIREASGMFGGGVGPDAILNFAAETHVDNSISNPRVFVETNVCGTLSLLGLAKELGIRYLQVSTDEVYGSLGPKDDPFRETTPLSPNSPYSASKAGADHLVQAWHATYGLDTVITRCSNNYGPYQFPEKLIPKAISNILQGKPVPVYGSGRNVRDWIHVEDHCRGILAALEKGKSGEVYNFGGGAEATNNRVVGAILACLGKGQVVNVADRPGHDFRYAMDYSKAWSELGWEPQHDFAEGLASTVAWYVENESWWKSMMPPDAGKDA